MKPDRLEALLSAYLDGELTEAERAEVEQTLERSPEARRLLEELRKTVDLVRGLPRQRLPDEFHEEVCAEVERSVLLRKPTRRGARLWNIIRWTAAAGTAAAAVLVLALVLGPHAARDESSPVTTEHEPAPPVHEALARLAPKAALTEGPAEELKAARKPAASAPAIAKEGGAPEPGKVVAGPEGEDSDAYDELGRDVAALVDALIPDFGAGEAKSEEAEPSEPPAAEPSTTVAMTPARAGRRMKVAPPRSKLAAARAKDARFGRAGKGGPVLTQAFLNKEFVRDLVIQNRVEPGDAVEVTRWDGSVPQVEVATVVDVGRTANQVQVVLTRNRVSNVAASVVEVEGQGGMRQAPIPHDGLAQPPKGTVEVQFYCEGERSQLSNVVMELGQQSGVVQSLALTRASSSTLSNIRAYQGRLGRLGVVPRRGRARRASRPVLAAVKPPDGPDDEPETVELTSKPVPGRVLLKKQGVAPESAQPAETTRRRGAVATARPTKGAPVLSDKEERLREHPKRSQAKLKWAARPEARAKPGQADTTVAQTVETQYGFGQAAATQARPRGRGDQLQTVRAQRRAVRSLQDEVQQAVVQTRPGRKPVYQLLIVVRAARAHDRRGGPEKAPATQQR